MSDRGASVRGGRRWPGRVLVPLACLALAAGVRVGSPWVARAADGQGAPRAPALELRIDPSDVDLERGQLTARLSRPAAKLTVRVLALSGAVLAEAEQAFDGAAAGTPLVVRWHPPAEAVARIEVFGHDTEGFYKGIAITPWSFEVPHEDVAFATDSAEIVAREAEKLGVSLRSIQKQLPLARRLGDVTLYVLAHTDTIGSAEYNLGLSTRRAQAIARWFRKHGLRIPIAYDGVGESMLKVKTADEVDEPRNRRVDYMLGVEPPRFKRSGAAPRWKRAE